MVIYLNSVSKIGFPGLRVGWVVAPRLLIQHLHALKQRSDLHGNLLAQAALADFARQGLLSKHIQRCRRSYVQRRDAMLEALQKFFPRESNWTAPEGGMAIWVQLPESVNASELQVHARSRGIYFTPGPRFYATGARTNTLRLSFTMLTAAQIEAGIKCLGELAEKQMISEQPDRSAQNLLARKALV